MKNLILSSILYLVISTTFVNGQSFTNSVDSTINKHVVFNYNNGNNQSHLTAEEPISFFLSLENTYPSDLSIDGELKHDGVSYALFSDYKVTENYLVVSPITKFKGESQGGNWQFSFEPNRSVHVQNWGVDMTMIPEPATITLISFGLAAALIFRRKVI
jgi:hypothetical protein